MAGFFSNLFNRMGNHGVPPANKEEDKNTDPRVQEKNPNFDSFNSVSQSIDQIIAARSIVNSAIKDVNSWGSRPMAEVVINGFETIALESDKQTRIRQYRAIADYQECNWCLEEIAEDFLHVDENGDFIKLTLNLDRKDLTEQRRDIVQNEFRKFVNLFHFEEDAFNLCKKFLVEGELAWENIINPDHPDLGIIGLRQIPTEYYETLVNSKTGTKVGIFFDVKRLGDDIRMLVSNSYYGSYRVFNNVFGFNIAGPINRDDCIPMLWPQVTYISSDILSPDGMVCFPLIDRCKQEYYQLVLMEQSAVILRVTHAPERLLFNVNTGDLPDKKAEEYVRRFANNLKQKKVALDRPSADGQKAPQIANVYNPSTMLESWIFGKSNSNEGTSVESVGSNAQYDQIDDIKFFVKKLLKAFKVPYMRYESPDQMNEKAEQISYEEYSFAKLIMRLQGRFAKGIRNSFITHLKLRGIWEKYSLKESDLKIAFVPPVLFDLYNQQKLLETKVGMYSLLAEHDEFSKIMAMKNILHMTDAQIDENFKDLIKEKEFMAHGEWVSDQMQSNGPLNPKPPIPIKGVPEEGGEEGGEGGDMGGGDMGGGPEEGGEEAGGGEPPAGGEEPPPDNEMPAPMP